MSVLVRSDVAEARRIALIYPHFVADVIDNDPCGKDRQPVGYTGRITATIAPDRGGYRDGGAEPKIKTPRRQPHRAVAGRFRGGMGQAGQSARINPQANWFSEMPRARAFRFAASNPSRFHEPPSSTTLPLHVILIGTRSAIARRKLHDNGAIGLGVGSSVLHCLHNATNCVALLRGYTYKIYFIGENWGEVVQVGASFRRT